MPAARPTGPLQARGAGMRIRIDSLAVGGIPAHRQSELVAALEKELQTQLARAGMSGTDRRVDVLRLAAPAGLDIRDVAAVGRFLAQRIAEGAAG